MLNVVACFVDLSTRYQLHETEFDIIEDIYKHPLKLRHFDHPINRSRYFIDFGLMASKDKKRLYFEKNYLLMSNSNPLSHCFVDKFKRREYLAPDMATIMKASTAVGARTLKPGSREARG